MKRGALTEGQAFSIAAVVALVPYAALLLGVVYYFEVIKKSPSSIPADKGTPGETLAYLLVFLIIGAGGVLWKATGKWIYRRWGKAS